MDRGTKESEIGFYASAVSRLRCRVPDKLSPRRCRAYFTTCTPFEYDEALVLAEVPTGIVQLVTPGPVSGCFRLLAQLKGIVSSLS
jgi:hypothetical protein